MFLRDHAAAGDGATHRCSRDVLARHLEGATLQEAFLSSRMPPILSRLLEEGMVQGVLDHISRQAADVLADAGDELGAHAALSASHGTVHVERVCFDTSSTKPKVLLITSVDVLFDQCDAAVSVRG